MWVGTVPYSHWENRTWGYPTDCSGFVSWVLQTVGSVGRGLKAYEFAAPMYATQIPSSELRYGDIVTHVFPGKVPGARCATGGASGKELFPPDPFGYISGHVYFFDRWADPENNTFFAYESTEVGDAPPHFNHHVVKSTHQADHWAKDNCSSREYGHVTGGAHRLSARLLCPH